MFSGEILKAKLHFSTSDRISTQNILEKHVNERQRQMIMNIYQSAYTEFVCLETKFNTFRKIAKWT